MGAGVGLSKTATVDNAREMPVGDGTETALEVEAIESEVPALNTGVGRRIIGRGSKLDEAVTLVRAVGVAAMLTGPTFNKAVALVRAIGMSTLKHIEWRQCGKPLKVWVENVLSLIVDSWRGVPGGGSTDRVAVAIAEVELK